MGEQDNAGSAVGIAVQLKRLAHGAGLPLPAYETPAAAGMDLPAAVPADEPKALAPRERALIPTGFSLALPAGYEAQVRPRSRLAFRHGITVLNTPGTIDGQLRPNRHDSQAEYQIRDRFGHGVVVAFFLFRV